MKPRILPTARLSFAFALASALAALLAGTETASAAWTGASLGTTYAAGGTGDYDFTDNWASSTIDDSFSSFALTGDLTVTLDAARTTGAGGLNLDYSGAYNLSLVGITSSRAITLGGNVSADTVAGAQVITIGGGAGVSLNLNNATRTFTVGSGDTLVVNGIISSTTAASGLLTKDGAGALTLTGGASTFQGRVTLNTGTLNINKATALGTTAGGFTINGGAIDNTSGASVSVGAEPMTINSDFTFVGSNPLVWGAGATTLGTAAGTSRTITVTANTLTLGGVIANGTTANSLIKSGNGTLVLSGNNTYTGATTVSAGTLSLSNGTVIYDMSTVSVDTGAVLNLNYTGSDTIQVLNLGGSPVAAGKWGRIGSIAALGADHESALITGDGLLNNGAGYAWDGGTSDITDNGDGVSTGADGTWATTIQNWDRGITAHTAWGNNGSGSAIFGGTVGTVTLAEAINVKDITFTCANISTGYTISGGTLNFPSDGSGSITSSVPETEPAITSAITGSPTVNTQINGVKATVGGLNNVYNGITFAPTSGTVKLGTVNTSKGGGLWLGGTTTGNEVSQMTGTAQQGTLYKKDSGTWTVNGNASVGICAVGDGTLIINGTLSTNYQGLNPIPSGARLGGNLTYSHSATSTVGSFTVNSGGIVAPGNPAVANGVGTIHTSWGTGAAAVGATTFSAGSIYEWQVGAANATDVVHAVRTSTATNNNRTLTVDAMTLKIKDAGGTPLATDQLPVFTYDTGVVRTLSLGSVVFDTSDLVGKGWTIGTLALTDNGSGTIYLTGLSKGGSLYDTWANGSEPFDGDANNDGVDDGLAWFLGASGPGVSALDKLPVPSTPTGYLQLDFSRQNPYAPAKLYLEYGNDLSGWTKLEIPADTGTIGGDIEVTVTAGPPDGIKIKIPTATHAVAGKLFARLSATEN